MPVSGLLETRLPLATPFDMRIEEGWVWFPPASQQADLPPLIMRLDEPLVAVGSYAVFHADSEYSILSAALLPRAFLKHFLKK